MLQHNAYCALSLKRNCRTYILYTIYAKSLLISEGGPNHLSCISYMRMILIECQIYIAMS